MNNSYSNGIRPAIKNGWIGVDLDGTLAVHNGWYGVEHIGEPIPIMIDRVRQWIIEGVEVRIFTARNTLPDGAKYVALWLAQQGLPPLRITHEKDMLCMEIWDDRAVAIERNTGRII